MPGRVALITGASAGIGLGHEFLAHLERARMLVHVVDAAQEDLKSHYSTIRGELSRYGAGLDALPEVVVLNKTDLVPPGEVAALVRRHEGIAVSAHTRSGMAELIAAAELRLGKSARFAGGFEERSAAPTPA